MDDNDFKRFVIEKLNEIEHRLTEIETMVSDYHKFIKIGVVIGSFILSALGIKVGVIT